MNKQIKVSVKNKRLPLFRRAGITFSAKPTIIDCAALTEAQLEQLSKEPNLRVEAVGIESQNTAPAVSQREQLAILIGELNIDNGELWTNSGKPKTSVLESMVNRTVTAEERDEAYALFKSYLQSGLVDHAVDGATDTGE